MLSKVFEQNQAALVAQALECKFPEFLLEMLRAGLDDVENSQSVKAHLVQALKAMSR